MSSPHVTYARRGDATPEAELNALSSVYRFVLDSHAKKKAGVNGTGGDTKGPIKNEVRAKLSIPDTR